MVGVPAPGQRATRTQGSTRVTGAAAHSMYADWCAAGCWHRAPNVAFLFFFFFNQFFFFFGSGIFLFD